MMDRDNITRTGARAPGVEQHVLLEWRCFTERVSSAQTEGCMSAAESTKDGNKLDRCKGYAGAGLTGVAAGKVLSESQPLSRIGGNPPYGILGGTMETSASFEARSAPLSYPTIGFRCECRRRLQGGRLHPDAR